MDIDPILPRRQPIKYGRYGQVEAGQLRFDIVSYDGREQSDPHHPHISLGPENILRHDRSVYCSSRPTCNIVLKHQDDTPFCLEKIHIIGPENGFRTPVREGQVYVAMDIHDLLRYQDPPPYAQRRAGPSASYRQRREPRSSYEQITLSDALRDPNISAALDSHDRTTTRSGDVDNQMSDAWWEDFDFDAFLSGDVDDDSSAESSGFDLPCPFAQASESSSRPVAFLSDNDLAPEDPSSAEILTFRDSRERAARLRRFDQHSRFEPNGDWSDSAHSDDRDYDRDTRSTRDGRYNSYSTRLDALTPQHRLRHAYLGRPTVHHPFDADGSSTSASRTRNYNNNNNDNKFSNGSSHAHSFPPGSSSSNPNDPDSDPRVTRAYFRMRPKKNAVTINFKPALSGCFILLKLWGARDAGTVDVQSVVAMGFGGCRFFPATEMR